MLREQAKTLERRRHRRVPLERTVEIQVRGWSTLRVWGHDISCGGIRLTVPGVVLPGERVTVDLTLPNGIQLNLKGEVRHVLQAPAGGNSIVGLRWLDAGSDEVQLLTNLVAAESA